MKLKSTLWALALAFAAVSCSDDLDSPNGKNTEKGETALINVMISTGTATKATPLPPTPGEDGDGSEAGSSEESEVENVMVILYQNSSSLTDYEVLSESEIKAIGYSDVVGELTTGGGVNNHAWHASVEVKVTGETIDLGNRTFGVITVANAGDLTDDINALDPKTLGSLGDMLQKTIHTNNSKFVMSTHTIGGGETRLKESTITLITNATEGNIPTVNAYVERLAAKIRLGEATDVTNFEYEVKNEGETEPLATVVLNSVAVVNQLNSGTYLLKRVSTDGYDVDSDDEESKDLGETIPTDKPDKYLGNETGSASAPSTNFVIDPWTRIKRLANGKFPNALPTNTVNNTQLKYTNHFEGTTYKYLYPTFSGTKTLTGEGAETFDGQKVLLCYTQENTSPVEGSVHGYSTGAIFKATYKPKKWMTEAGTPVEVTYDGNNPKSFYLYKGVIYENREAIIAGIVTRVGDPDFSWNNIKGGITYTEETKNKFLASPLSKEKGPFGYVTMIEEKLNAGKNVPGFTEWIGADQSYNIDKPNTVLFYENGECYYRYWIRHANNNNPTKMGVMEFGIVRNNIYDLTVTKIGKLGLSGDEKPDPEEPDENDEFLFNVILHVKDWTLRTNNIEF